jgi:hypothetical protein
MILSTVEHVRGSMERVKGKDACGFHFGKPITTIEIDLSG